MIKEKWRDIAEYEGIYQVSNMGNVRSLKREVNGVHIPPALLKPSTYGRYYRVKLYKNGIGKMYMIHRLVAKAFIANHENKPQVNHKDGNRLNNTAANLEWCTQSENNKHAIRNNLNSIEPMLAKTRKKVLQLDRHGFPIKEWESMSQAAKCLNIQVANISKCCAGLIETTGGYQWRLSSKN